jgi:uncharacterized protein YkwD
MRSNCLSLSLLCTLAGLVSAGCPVDSSQDLQRGTSSAGGSTGVTTASGTGSPFVGPPTTGNDPNSAPPSTTDTGAVSPTLTAGGVSTNTPTASTPDALTVTYAGCLEPVEGAFWRAEVLRLVNQERRSRGLQSVAQSPALEQEATQYACELIYYRFFDHVNPQTSSQLRDRATDFGYDFWIIGENLAAGQRTPAEAVQAWMNSPCHRQNVLNPAFTELGIGVRVGGDYGYYWVQEFGRPYSGPPYPGAPYHDPECQESE